MGKGPSRIAACFLIHRKILAKKLGSENCVLLGLSMSAQQPKSHEMFDVCLQRDDEQFCGIPKVNYT